MKKFNFQILASCFLAVAFLFSACVKDEFDAPPSEVIPDIEANATVADLVALIQPNQITQIEEDLIVRAVVTGNDEDGNFFRELVVQDETGGLYLNINLTNAFNFFPLGREVFIQARGLYIIEDNLVPKLGGYIAIENGDEELGDIQDLNDHLIRGRRNQFVTPAKVTMNELGVEHLATLIELENVEFVNLGETFADAQGNATQNKDLQDCTGNDIVVRTSGFASFAGATIPTGNGSLFAIYSQFNGDGQLFIRNLTDVEKMTGPRCDGTTGTGGTGNETLLTIEEVKDIYNGGAGSAPNETKMTGIVISDIANENTPSRNLHLQDGEHGIIVRFQNNHSFSLNDRIEVVISNQELSEFNGALQVNEVPNNLATFIETASSPTPRVATVAEILANNDLWESTLVTIEGATISGDANYRFNDISDATGTISMFTQSFASFTNELVPTGTVKITGIIGQFNDPQINIRNLGDVEDDGGGTGGGDPEQISIEAVRGLWNSGSTSVVGDKFIRGVVISDRANANINNRNVVVQDGDFGIVVRFADENTYNLGDEIEVNVSNQGMSEFNGLLQLLDVPNGNASLLGTGGTVTAKTASVSDILANAEQWESTVVIIEDVLIEGAGTYAGSTTVTDGSGSIPMFTFNGATFSGEALPGSEVIMTAVVSQFNDPQVFIRSLDDVVE